MKLGMNGTVKISLDDFKTIDDNSNALCNFKQSLDKLISAKRLETIFPFVSNGYRRIVLIEDIEIVKVMSLIFETFYENVNVFKTTKELEDWIGGDKY